MTEAQIIRSQEVDLSLGQNWSLGQIFLAVQFFFILVDISIETATRDIDMLLQVLLKFCSNNRFAAISDVIFFFTHYWTTEY